MNVIRQARDTDLERIAEIEVFNYRLNFYPIFRSDEFYFGEFCVSARMEEHRKCLNQFYVYDDGVVKGFIQIDGQEVKKLFVEPALQGSGIGEALLEYAISKSDVRFLWALEKNIRAIAFYQRHGFRVTTDKKPEEDTDECLVRLVL